MSSFASLDLARPQFVPNVRNTSANHNDPLAAFFALYRPFKYNCRASSHNEYRRMCAFYGWPNRKQEPNHIERDEAWERFRIAMVKAFNTTFGDDENDIKAWGRMCKLVGMKHVPDTLEARREVRKPYSLYLCYGPPSYLSCLPNPIPRLPPRPSLMSRITANESRRP